MSNIYIILTDRNGIEYRCDSVSEALAVSNYIVSKFGALKMVRSNSNSMLDDFERITSYFNTKEVNNG